MNLPALQHLVNAARALADDCHILVLGSASLLASVPQLGEAGNPLASTYDADICPDPFEETTGRMLDEALGESRAFHLRHGYHADILRSSIFETLPRGWRQRLVAVPGCPHASALDPHDLAAVKLLVARPKDLMLLRNLHQQHLLNPKIVEDRLASIQQTERQMIHSAKAFHQVFAPQA